MTNWLPKLDNHTGSTYVRIADAIETDITSGVLPVGSKLPPQRNLAFDIGVTIGTIGRGYKLAIQRGLLEAGIGRGTYVKDRTLPVPQTNPADVLGAPTHFEPPNRQKLRKMDVSRAADIGQAEIVAPLLSEIALQQPDKVLDYVRQIEPHWQEAGARWMATGGWYPEVETVFPTQGAHSAIISIITACTAPGDKIAIEDLTYAPVAEGISLQGRRIVPVRTTLSGLDLDDLESVLAQQHPKILIVTPTLHNPTTAVMNVAHRKRLAELARLHNILIIEDNIYGKQLENPPAPVAAYAPERTFHVSGLAKSFAAGMRAGWLSGPSRFNNRIMVANKSITGGKPYLLAELAAQLISNGIAEEISQKIRILTKERELMVREIFDGCNFVSNPCAPFFWLKLEEPWLPAAFRAAAHQQNILIAEASQFVVSHKTRLPHRVRIGIASIKDNAELRDCLMILRDLVRSPPGAYHNYD